MELVDLIIPDSEAVLFFSGQTVILGADPIEDYSLFNKFLRI